MTDKLKVAAVVVTYNRKNLLKGCLDSLLTQTRRIDSIILLDNASTDGTPEFLESLGYLANPTIDYVRLPENSGGAGGFHDGVKRGHELGFDWLWIMDDDAEPKKDCLLLALKGLNLIKDNKIGVIAPIVSNENGNIGEHHRAFIDIERFPSSVSYLGSEFYTSDKPLKITHASFVGPLISRIAIDKIGYPNKDFFIYYDDLEYSIRINKFFNMFLIPQACIIHNDKKPNTLAKDILGLKSRRTPLSRYYFDYFSIRNLVFLYKKYNNNRLKYLGIITRLLRSTTGILLFDDHKFLRMRVQLSAYKDGLLGNFKNNRKYLNSKS